MALPPYFLIFFSMGLFSGLFEVAKLPVSAALDVITLGGVVADRNKSFTKQNCEDIDDAFRE